MFHHSSCLYFNYNVLRLTQIDVNAILCDFCLINIMPFANCWSGQPQNVVSNAIELFITGYDKFLKKILMKKSKKTDKIKILLPVYFLLGEIYSFLNISLFCLASEQGK